MPEGDAYITTTLVSSTISFVVLEYKTRSFLERGLMTIGGTIIYSFYILRMKEPPRLSGGGIALKFRDIACFGSTGIVLADFCLIILKGF